MAAATDHIEIAQALVKAGADVNALNSAKVTPLHYAAAASSMAMVDFLHQAGADVNASNRFDMSPLIAAIKGDDAPMVERLLALGGHLKGVEKSSGASFFCAAQNGLVDQVKLYVRAGCDMNDSSKLMPLYGAALKGHRKVVLALLEAGAEVNARQPHVLETALHIASNMGHLDLMKDLIKAHADVNLANHVGSTPLMEAAIMANVKACTLLLENKADHAALNKKGMSAMHCAAIRGFDQVVSELIKFGADINIPGKDGMTPLHLAAQKATPEACIALIRMGADPFKKNDKGVSAAQLVKNSKSDARRANAISIRSFGDSQKALRVIEELMAMQGPSSRSSVKP
jgi:ankyrin repeat protein